MKIKKLIQKLLNKADIKTKLYEYYQDLEIHLTNSEKKFNK